VDTKHAERLVSRDETKKVQCAVASSRHSWTNFFRPLAAGLAGLRIHDLRHTAVALWIAAWASPKEVAARAGHTSVSFILDRYGHLFPESDAALRDRLELLFRGATEQRRNTAG
jgi:integrase